jgi:hypothetical protein
MRPMYLIMKYTSKRAPVSRFICPGLICLIGLSACELNPSCNCDDNPSKLLVAIKENDKLISEFKYDGQNRLVQLDIYYNDSVWCSEYYQYTPDNKLVKRTHSGFIDTYEYSSTGKLKSATQYYQATEKEWKTEYHYSGNKINRGTTYFNGSETGYVVFKYDSNGNTIERTEYLKIQGQDDFMDSQFKMTYDDQVNPLVNHYQYPIDVIQKNNPTYYYYYMSIMSSFPPEFNSSYEYDEEGLPVKEYRGQRILEYEYVEIDPH